ncbi:aspartate-glutamate racemase family [Perilla frutescens var. frutescens]|nr:aspartate-glutamate racemase family [Perilla frutescens var. frutescens]
MHCLLSQDAMQRKGNRNRATVRLTASIIHQAEEIHAPSAVTHQTNVIGILGGDSSLNFAKKLVDHERELPFVLCTDPVLSNELLSLDRGSLHCISGKPARVHIDHSSIVENLRCKRAILEKSGVCCIVMPCHALHSWQDEIEEGCSVPFIHMGESVANELKEAKLRPVQAGTPLSIGVLATNTTLVTRVYREKLENEGFDVVMPDENTIKHIVIPAVDALSTKDFEGARNLLRISLHILLVRAVNRIILASDELREILPPDDPLWRKCIDPMDALARSTVKYAQSAGRR